MASGIFKRFMFVYWIATALMGAYLLLIVAVESYVYFSEKRAWDSYQSLLDQRVAVVPLLSAERRAAVDICIAANPSSMWKCFSGDGHEVGCGGWGNDKNECTLQAMNSALAVLETMKAEGVEITPLGIQPIKPGFSDRELVEFSPYFFMLLAGAGLIYLARWILLGSGGGG